MQRRAHDLAEHVERKQRVTIYLQEAVVFRNDADFSFFRLILDFDAVSHERPRDRVGRLVLMQFVVSNLQHEKMLLAEPLEMTNVLFANDVAFFEGAALELAWPDLGYIMSEDRAYGLGYRNCFA